MEKRGKAENQEACLNSHDLSCCLGKVVYHSENNTAACVQRPQWRNSMAREHSECICVLSTLTLLFWDGRGLVVGYGKAKRRKCKGSDRCLHLSELTLNHSNHRNLLSGRTGPWVKERLLQGYFWLLLWMLLPIVCLCIYHNHGDHMFFRLACVKVVNFNFPWENMVTIAMT